LDIKKVMAVPKVCAYAMVAICILGIIVGTFFDYSINVTLANKTDLGAFFATYGSYFSYCLYPAAGMCIFKGLMKKSERFKMLAWVIMVISYFIPRLVASNSSESKSPKTIVLVALHPLRIRLSSISYTS
jgi:amino acid transporter